MRRNLSTYLYVFFLFMLFAKPAHAYLDPGTGSYVFQIVIAGLVGALFAIKTFWNSIKETFFKFLTKKNPLPKNK